MPGSADANSSSTPPYDGFCLEHAGMLGGFVKAGVEPVLAAKISKALVDYEFSARGKVPARLDELFDPAAKAIGIEGFDPPRFDDFWMHHYLRTRAGERYRGGQALERDVAIEIADREFVSINWGMSSRSLATGVRQDWESAFRITGWGRGEAIVVSVAEDVSNWDFERHPDAKEELRRIEAEFQRGRKNAIGRLQVNISLAVRNALDAVHDVRAQKQ